MRLPSSSRTRYGNRWCNTSSLQRIARVRGFSSHMVCRAVYNLLYAGRRLYPRGTWTRCVVLRLHASDNATNRTRMCPFCLFACFDCSVCLPHPALGYWWSWPFSGKPLLVVVNDALMGNHQMELAVSTRMITRTQAKPTMQSYCSGTSTSYVKQVGFPYDNILLSMPVDVCAWLWGSRHRASSIQTVTYTARRVRCVVHQKADRPTD